MKKQKLISVLLLSTLVLSSLSTPTMALAETAKIEPKIQANRVNIVQTGKWGTSGITLDSEGVLRVGTGAITNGGYMNEFVGSSKIKKLSVKEIIFEGTVELPVSCESMFGGYSNIATVKNWDNLTKFDFGNVDASKVKNMSYAFRGSKIENIDLSNVNFPNVTTFYYMFGENGYGGNTTTKKINLSNVSAPKATNMERMFNRANSLEELNLSDFNAPLAKNSSMFSGTSKLKKLTLGSEIERISGTELPSVKGVAPYTGGWVNIDTGELFDTSALFMSGYRGATDAGTYVWQEHVQPVTVKYVNEQGTSLAPQSTLTGSFSGQKFTTTPKVITGYKVKEIQGLATGVFMSIAQTVTYIYERVAGAPVTVNFKDTEGNLLDSTTLNGLWGDAWTADSKVMDGYEVVDIPAKENGIFGDNPQTIDYIYKKLLPGDVLVEYLDEDGQDIKDADVLTGLHGTTYTTTAPVVEGFELKTTPANANGTFDQDNSQKVTYVYARLQGAPVTVKYVDETGKELATADVLNGKFGTIFDTNPKAINGYFLTKAPENESGEFTMNPQTVTYVYAAQTASTITVNYVDQDGGLLDSETLNGKFDEAYTTEQKAITGYDFTGLGQGSAPTTGTFTLDTQTVTYQYQAKEAAPVTVKYVDTLGNELGLDTLTGLFGTDYTTEAKEFAGYALKTTPNNTNGTFSMDTQTVTYVYEAGRGGTITVKYINQEGNEIAAVKTLNGKVGQSFSETAKMPSGYNLIGDSVRTFKVTAEPQTMVFEYVGKNASKLTIQYIDEVTGDQIAPATGFTGGKTGDAYSAEVKVIPGYTVVDASKATGFRPMSATTYKIAYKKNDAISFDLNYVGVNQQKVIGFLPTGVTTTKLSLFVKKAGDDEWEDSGYTGTADAATGYFAIESRLVKGGKGFLLENQDQVKVVFTGNDGNSYEAVKVVQPYTAPAVDDYTAGEDNATGTVPNGANFVRLMIKNKPIRTVATTPTPGSSLLGNIDAKTGNFTVYAKNYSDGGKFADTKVGDTLTFDYGLQIYGAQNNPSTTIIAK